MWCSRSEVWSGYTYALLVATATPGTKRCGVREASELFCTTPCPVLLKLEHASGSLEGLLTQISGQPPTPGFLVQ